MFLIKWTILIFPTFYEVPD